jgi:hypothetical protein
VRQTHKHPLCVYTVGISRVGLEDLGNAILCIMVVCQLVRPSKQMRHSYHTKPPSSLSIFCPKRHGFLLRMMLTGCSRPTETSQGMGKTPRCPCGHATISHPRIFLRLAHRSPSGESGETYERLAACLGGATPNYKTSPEHLAS